MYKKSHKIRNFIFIIVTVILLSVIGYFLYDTYINISVTPEYEIKRTGSTINSETVENAVQNSNSVANMLEKVSQSVVGISKIKSRSNSIFSNNSISELGLGTGIIVSSNGYILSNCHVTGEELSTCYITLENGYTYQGQNSNGEESYINAEGYEVGISYMDFFGSYSIAIYVYPPVAA